MIHSWKSFCTTTRTFQFAHSPCLDFMLLFRKKLQLHIGICRSRRLNTSILKLSNVCRVGHETSVCITWWQPTTSHHRDNQGVPFEQIAQFEDQSAETSIFAHFTAVRLILVGWAEFRVLARCNDVLGDFILGRVFRGGGLRRWSWRLNAWQRLDGRRRWWFFQIVRNIAVWRSNCFWLNWWLEWKSCSFSVWLLVLTAYTTSAETCGHSEDCCQCQSQHSGNH